MKEKIHTGLAGFGLSGKILIAPFVQAHSGFVLSKVLERSTDQARQLYPESQTVRTFDELIADPKLDLIIISTPNIFHFEMAKQALENGKHVLVEKPITPTFEQAQQLIEIAEKHQRILSVFQNRRWDSGFRTLQKILEDRLLGEIVEYEAHFDRYTPTLEPQAWREKPQPAGGILYDLGPHLIDQALQLFGTPRAVWADIRTQRPESPVDDYFDLQLIYPQTKVSLRAGMYAREPGAHLIVHGTKGSYIKYGLDCQEEALKQGTVPGTPGWGKDPESLWPTLNTELDGLHFRGKTESLPGNWMLLFENLYQAIAKGAELTVKPQQAAQTIRIIEKAFESAQTRKTIQL